MADRPKVYWEASPFCATFNDERGRSHICFALLEAARKGEIELYTSTLTLIEVFKIPATPSEEEAERQIQRFFRNRWIRKQTPDWFVAIEARRLQRQFPHLDGRDATHLATAVYLGCEYLHTYDQDDLIRCNGQVPNLLISVPQPFTNTNYPMDLQPDQPTTGLST